MKPAGSERELLSCLRNPDERIIRVVRDGARRSADGAMEGVNHPLKQRVGVLPQDPDDVEDGQCEPQHGRVFSQGLAFFGAEKFSAEIANV
jgi:hypothetical protein